MVKIGRGADHLFKPIRIYVDPFAHVQVLLWHHDDRKPYNGIHAYKDWSCRFRSSNTSTWDITIMLSFSIIVCRWPDCMIDGQHRIPD
jgi:hypothetical protein